MDFFCSSNFVIEHCIEKKSQYGNVPNHTVYFTDLDPGSEMTIFESVLTTFTASVVFRDSWVSRKNWLELKIEPQSVNLACLNW
jgi:hypothetical protein